MKGCAPVISVDVFNGSGNVFALTVEGEDGELMASLAVITRVTLQIGATLVDSDVHSSLVWWNETKEHYGATVAVIKMRLGGLGLSPGKHADCVLKLYDGTHPDGQRVSNIVEVRVHEQ